MFATVRPAPTPAGGRLVSVDGRVLPLLGTRIEADTCAGLCRVQLVQRFRNPFADPLHVTYQVPLPADGAVSGYAFELEGRRVVGEVKPLQDARRTFEDAVLAGRTAALLEQDRSSLFTQSLGNVPPGAEITVTLTIDQPLMWEDGGWAWRFPTVVAPRYLNELTPDPQRLAVDVADRDVGVRTSVRLAIRDALTGPVTSPSHGVSGAAVFTLEDVPLDRDVVVCWRVAGHSPGLSLDTASAHGQGFGALTVVPPYVAGPPVARDLIVLLDTSGSMSGEPLAQAQAVVEALLDTLNPADRLELIEFSNQARRWKRSAVSATPRNVQGARRWLRGLRACGGTEMRTGILAALTSLRAEAQRQVILVTDGLIGAETQIVAAIQNGLPTGCRVHTVGIGSGVNRSLTAPAARAGHGVEVIVPPYADVAPAIRTLVARTNAPQVVDLTVSGTAVRAVAPAALPDLFAQAPARIAVELNPAGGTVEVRGRTVAGAFVQTLSVPPLGGGNPAVATLFARECVEDLEQRRAAGESAVLDQEIETLGVRFGIATRLTAWVAVSRAVTVDPRAPTRASTVPHALAQGLSAEGVGLRGAVSQDSFAMFEVAAGEAAVDGMFGGAVGHSSGGGGAPGAPPPPPMVEAPAPQPAPSPRRPSPKRSRRAAAPEESLARADLDDDESPEPVERGTAKSAQKKRERAPRRVLKGRIVRRGDQWIFEVEISEATPWTPGLEVEVHFADGRIETWTVDADTTTAAGSLAPGQVARLVLSPTSPPALDPVSIHLAGMTIKL